MNRYFAPALFWTVIPHAAVLVLLGASIWLELTVLDDVRGVAIDVWLFAVAAGLAGQVCSLFFLARYIRKSMDAPLIRLGKSCAVFALVLGYLPAAGAYGVLHDYMTWRPSRDIFEAVSRCRHQFRMAEVARMVKENPDLVRARNALGETPLHLAVGRGRGELVELLLAKGADVNAVDEQGATPLHEAAGETDPRDLVVLIQHGADVNHKTVAGETPLHWAAQWAQNECVEVLLRNGARPGERDASGETPIDKAKKQMKVQRLHGERWEDWEECIRLLRRTTASEKRDVED